MSALPISIEGYLRDSGFSTTELLVLRHLLGGGSMTLRQLAAKTGKSTGVLDQATKKLFQRGILSREQVNNGSRYILRSLDAIRDWIDKEHREEIARQRRRAEDVSAFLETISLQRKRPHLEYFEGETAFADLLSRLLAEASTELLQYLPLSTKEEDDPHADLREEWTKQRKRRNLKLRVLAPDTMLGRRFRDRDPFMQRVTALSPAERSPFGMEQFMTDEWLACCDHNAHRYCLMKFPEFVENQRLLFESFWNDATGANILFFTPARAQPQTVALPA